MESTRTLIFVLGGVALAGLGFQRLVLWVWRGRLSPEARWWKVGLGVGAAGCAMGLWLGEALARREHEGAMGAVVRAGREEEKRVRASLAAALRERDAARRERDEARLAAKTGPRARAPMLGMGSE